MMTPEQIAAMRADAEAGTKGPWAVCGDGRRVKPAPIDQFFAPIADTSNTIQWSDGNWQDVGNSENTARRIARVPDMEATIIAQAAEIERLRNELYERGAEYAG